MMSSSLLTASTPASFHLHHGGGGGVHHHLSTGARHKRHQLSSILTSSPSVAHAGQQKAAAAAAAFKARTRITTNPNVLTSTTTATARVVAAAFLTQSLSDAVVTVANLKAQLLAHHYSTNASLAWNSVDDGFVDDTLFANGLAEHLAASPTSDKQRRNSLQSVQTAAAEEKRKQRDKAGKRVRFADSVPGRELAQVKLFQSSDDDEPQRFTTTTTTTVAVQKVKVNVCRQQSINKMSPMLLKHLKESLESSRSAVSVRASSIRRVNKPQEDVLTSLSDDDDDEEEEQSDEATADEAESSDEDALFRSLPPVKPVKTDSVEALLEKRMQAVKLESVERVDATKGLDSESKSAETNRFDIDNFSFEWQLAESLRQELGRAFEAAENVRLIKLSVDKMCISGQITVRNLCYHKRVYLNYTFDNWLTTQTLECAYQAAESAERQADVFAFKYDLDKSLILRLIDENFNNRRAASPTAPGEHGKYRTAPPSFRFEFAVAFDAVESAERFWDNNRGQNYHLDCFFKISSPIRRCL